MLTPAQQRQHRSVTPVDRIDPCHVAVLPHNDGVHFYMLRDKGTDRTDVNDFYCDLILFLVHPIFHFSVP